MGAAEAIWSQAGARLWDVLVVGAGPAGALAARQVALAGARTLLVDKASFPRPKVCGCCLNRSALEALRSAGLQDVPARLAARPLSRWRLYTPRTSAACRLNGSVAVSREALDWALVEQAVRAGADFMPDTAASVVGSSSDARILELRQAQRAQTVKARMVIAASGLSGAAWRELEQLQPQVSPHARIGAGITIDDASDVYEDGTIHMVYGKRGYVGLVRIEDGRLNIAAALDVRGVRQSERLVDVVRAIVEAAHLRLPDAALEAAWKGTPALTRRPRQVYAERLLAIGDAAGYVEPFTGEGIAWALWSALAAAPLAVRAAEGWSETIGREWQQWHGGFVRRRQRICRFARWALRHAVVAESVAGLMSIAPWILVPALRAIDRTPRTLAAAAGESMRRAG